jgi:oligopeptide transport system substrate-binding protein
MAEEQSKQAVLGRRKFLALAAAGAGATALAACGGAIETPTSAPAQPSTAPTAAGPAPTATEIPRSVGSGVASPTAAVGSTATARAAASPTTAATVAANLAAKQIFRYCDVEPPSFDPGVGSSPYNMPQIFDGLLGVNWIDGSFDLLCSEGYSANADATAFTFKVKSGLKWSDGSPLTAKDFEYSWKRVLDPKTASKYTDSLAMIKNAPEVGKGTATLDQLGIKATNDTTLEVTLNKATPFFPLITATWTCYPVPQQVITKVADKWVEAENILSNGPYYMKEWKHDQLQAFEINPNYTTGPKPTVTRVECNIYADSTVLQKGLQAYENNELDTAQVAAADYDRAKADATLSKQLKGFPGSSTYMMHFDCTNKPTDNAKVRQAFALGYDRKGLIDVVLKGYYLDAPTVLPSDIPGNNPQAALQGGIDKAKSLLSEAGFANGQGFPTDFTIVYAASSTVKTVLEYLQQEWKKNLGIGVQLQSLETKAYVEWRIARTTQPFNAHFGQWGSDYGDPSNWHNQLFISSTDFYKTHWKNAEYDDLCAKAAGMADKAQREAAYKQAEVILMNELPHLPLYHGQSFFVIKPNIQGIYHPAILGTVPRGKYVTITK